MRKTRRAVLGTAGLTLGVGIAGCSGDGGDGGGSDDGSDGADGGDGESGSDGGSESAPEPTEEPTDEPTEEPTDEPTEEPTETLGEGELRTSFSGLRTDTEADIEFSGSSLTAFRDGDAQTVAVSGTVTNDGGATAVVYGLRFTPVSGTTTYAVADIGHRSGPTELGSGASLSFDETIPYDWMAEEQRGDIEEATGLNVKVVAGAAATQQQLEAENGLFVAKNTQNSAPSGVRFEVTSMTTGTDDDGKLEVYVTVENTSEEAKSLGSELDFAVWSYHPDGYELSSFCRQTAEPFGDIPPGETVEFTLFPGQRGRTNGQLEPSQVDAFYVTADAGF